MEFRFGKLRRPLGALAWLLLSPAMATRTAMHSELKAWTRYGAVKEHPNSVQNDLRPPGLTTNGARTLLGAPCIATNGARTLLGTSASLVVTSALLVVTRSY